MKKNFLSSKTITQMQTVYVLMADEDGTTFSPNKPIGVAVTSKTEAEKFVTENNIGYSRSYQKIIIFENQEEAVKFLYSRYMPGGDIYKKIFKDKFRKPN